MKNLLQLIFLSSDPDNEEIKVLVYDCLYIPWLKGDFFPEFAPEHTGSYFITVQKPSGGIRVISPVDIWRRSTGHYCQNYTTNVQQNLYRHSSKLQEAGLVKRWCFSLSLLPKRIIFGPGFHIGRRHRGPLGYHEG
jgi:hypothetical protein